MKTQLFILIIGIIFYVSCSTNTQPNAKKTKLEIYETVMLNDIPKNIIMALIENKIPLNPDRLSPIVGYLRDTSSISFITQLSTDDFILLPTITDNEKKHINIVAVKKTPAIKNSDIKKTKPNKNNIEIYFTMAGAQKWADFTKNNIGNAIAISINQTVFDLPLINAEIKNGMAMLRMVKNEEIAQELSNSINASLK